MSSNIGDETKQSFQDLLEALRRDRERLHVQFKLGKKELTKEWEMIERKWEILDQTLSEFGEEARDVAHRTAEEIRTLYQTFKDKKGSD